MAKRCRPCHDGPGGLPSARPPRARLVHRCRPSASPSGSDGRGSHPVVVRDAALRPRRRRRRRSPTPRRVGRIRSRPATLAGAARPARCSAGSWSGTRAVQPACSDGVPTLAIVDASGRQLRVTPSSAPSPLEQGIVLRPGQSAPALNEDPPSGLASETFQWFNWCGPAPAGPLSLAVTLPSGGSAILPIVFAGGDTSAPRCDDPAAPSTMTVSAFEETPGPDPTEPPSGPCRRTSPDPGGTGPGDGR